MEIAEKLQSGSNGKRLKPWSGVRGLCREVERAFVAICIDRVVLKYWHEAGMP